MAAFDHRVVRAAICAVLRSVPEIGHVHDHQVYADRESVMREYYAHELDDGSQQIRGWHVRRVGWTTRSEGVLHQRETRWAISGFVSLSEALGSELEFDDLLDLVADAFAADVTLGGTVGGTDFDEQTAVQADDLGPVMFAGVLCHEARLSLRTWETGTRDELARP